MGRRHGDVFEIKDCVLQSLLSGRENAEWLGEELEGHRRICSSWTAMRVLVRTLDPGFQTSFCGALYFLFLKFRFKQLNN
jgi:hypothetical protein